MNDKELTAQDLLLQQRAARLVERTLPDQIRRAYGDTPEDDRKRARATLVARGHLTQSELDNVSVEDAIAIAVKRVREQIASLEQQAAQQARQAKGRADRVTKPPRTVR
jgi:hypothetical protein